MRVTRRGILKLERNTILTLLGGLSFIGIWSVLAGFSVIPFLSVADTPEKMFQIDMASFGLFLGGLKIRKDMIPIRRRKS